jgi:16S rRNA (cytosine1402-N4)-methyltransferase
LPNEDISHVVDAEEPRAHVSVLLDEVMELLQPRGGVRFRALDCTLGAGGHAFALLERSAPDGTLVGLDADAEALALSRARLAPFDARVELHQRNFGELAELEIGDFDAILMDLGLSSMQLDSSGRGFSLRGDEPLDMRFDATSTDPTAADLLNTLPEAELERILREYGEERRGRAIARRIVQRRPLERTNDLVGAVTSVLGPTRGRIHPATRTFQALRIAVNDELGALERGLDAAADKLRPHGRMAAISFHSLEDRIVKWRFRRWADEGRVRILTRRPLVASAEEEATNPRSRSAKLRVAERAA